MTQRAQQSTFVTVLAWLALLISGFSALMGVLQSVFIAFTMPIQPMSSAESVETSPVFRFIFENFPWIVFTLTAVWGSTFVCAFGLLRRREWARKGFVLLLVLGAVGTLLVGVLQQQSMGEMLAGAYEGPADAAAMMSTMRFASALFTVLFVGVFVLLAIRLSSRRVRAEFQRAT